MSSQQFAQLSHLTTESRARALAEMSSGTELDVLVIGGGITGAGIALDAATRGLRTGIVEAGLRAPALGPQNLFTVAYVTSIT